MAAGPNPIQAMALRQILMRIAAARAGGGGMPPGAPAPGGAPGMPPGMAPGADAGPPVPGPGMAGQPGGGAPGGMSGMTSASPDDAQKDQLSKELSVMRVANPQMMMEKIKQIKQDIVTLLNHSAMSIPGVARSLSKTFVGLDGALKEAQTAAATQQVTQQPGIQSSMLPPGFPGGASSPAMGPGAGS